MKQQEAIFTKIDMDSWERKEYFLHYYNDVRCTYSITAAGFVHRKRPERADCVFLVGIEQ